MKIAAIDLGSNTFHLVIAEYIDSRFDVLFKTNKHIRLSEDITKNNRIIPAAFNRAIECLIEFKSIINQYDINQIRAVATSAVRNAINGSEFIMKAQMVSGIDIEIISGDEEAELIYEGVKLSGAIEGKSLIMDIGGGSTEFIFCDENKSYWKKSFDIGAARLMQKFWENDPITKEEQEQINNHLVSTLKALVEFNKSFGAKNLIGSAGAFETFMAMTKSNHNLEQEDITSARLNIDSYNHLSRELMLSTHQQRSNMPNLIPLRVDMIVMACLLTDYIISTLQIERIFMSTYDLKYGILASLNQ